MRLGQPAADQVVRPPGVSGVGPRPLIGEHTQWGTLGLCVQATWVLIMVRAHPGFQVCAPSPLIWVHTSWASDMCWGCLSSVHSPEAEGGGAPKAGLLWRVL